GVSSERTTIEPRTGRDGLRAGGWLEEPKLGSTESFNGTIRAAPLDGRQCFHRARGMASAAELAAGALGWTHLKSCGKGCQSSRSDSSSTCHDWLSPSPAATPG